MTGQALVEWLSQTWLASGGLIILVLALRGAVARRFGAQTAYRLWALPLVRLVLPSIVLPAWLAPRTTAVAVNGIETVVMVDPSPVRATADAAFDWTSVGLAVWLGGALAFLAWRTASYRAMRRRLLEGARPVGFAGDVQLVETAAVVAPVAFGVINRIVALPRGFMARESRFERDLAISHELAHHAGHDLLANFAAQAVLALHWFNPVAWLGWRAMRRDQEAACDARVMAGRDRATRAAYGRLVASFATGGQLALAAPIAGHHLLGPALGQRSIIHRLRSLTMNEPDEKRQRLGRALTALGFLLVPATASISWAQPAPPVSPAAPGAVAPAQPEAQPGMPPAPPAPGETRRVVRKLVILHKPRQEGAPMKTRTIVRNGATVTITSDEDIDDSELDKHLAELDAELPVPPVPPVPPAPGMRTERQVVIGSGHGEDGNVRVRKRIVVVDSDRPAPDIDLDMDRRGPKGRAIALDALRNARDDVARDSGIPANVKDKVLRKLDAQIEALGKQG